MANGYRTVKVNDTFFGGPQGIALTRWCSYEEARAYALYMARTDASSVYATESKRGVIRKV